MRLAVAGLIVHSSTKLSTTKSEYLVTGDKNIFSNAILVLPFLVIQLSNVLVSEGACLISCKEEVY